MNIQGDIQAEPLHTMVLRNRECPTCPTLDTPGKSAKLLFLNLILDKTSLSCKRERHGFSPLPICSFEDRSAYHQAWSRSGRRRAVRLVQGKTGARPGAKACGPAQGEIRGGQWHQPDAARRRQDGVDDRPGH